MKTFSTSVLHCNVTQLQDEPRFEMLHDSVALSVEPILFGEDELFAPATSHHVQDASTVCDTGVFGQKNDARVESEDYELTKPFVYSSSSCEDITDDEGCVDSLLHELDTDFTEGSTTNGRRRPYATRVPHLPPLLPSRQIVKSHLHTAPAHHSYQQQLDSTRMRTPPQLSYKQTPSAEYYTQLREVNSNITQMSTTTNSEREVARDAMSTARSRVRCGVCSSV
eukprot:Lankesteria_metandrocarpae@DN1355_c0_g1_i1.p1